jgi:tetratricopeptide (TPR) repeat protein
MHKMGLATFLLALSSVVPGCMVANTSDLEESTTYMKQQQYDKALACFDRITARDPRNSTVLMLKAGLLLQLQRYDEALASIDLALKYESNPGIVGPDMLMKGQLLAKLKRVDEGLAWADKAMQTMPEPWFVCTCLLTKAGMLGEADRFDQALACLNNARGFTADPQTVANIDQSVAIINQKIAARQAAQDAAAVKAQLELIRSQAKAWRALPAKPPLPGQVQHCRMLAEEAYQHHDYTAAAQNYEKGLALEPMWPQGHFNAALLHAEMAQFDVALDHMRCYLELAPDAPNAPAARDQIAQWEQKATSAAGAPAPDPTVIPALAPPAVPAGSTAAPPPAQVGGSNLK